MFDACIKWPFSKVSNRTTVRFVPRAASLRHAVFFEIFTVDKGIFLDVVFHFNLTLSGDRVVLSFYAV